MLAVHHGIIPKDPAQTLDSEGQSGVFALAQEAQRRAAEATLAFMRKHSSSEGTVPSVLPSTLTLDSWEAWGEDPAENLADGLHLVAVVDGFPSGDRLPSGQRRVLPGDWDTTLVSDYGIELLTVLAATMPGYWLSRTYTVTSLTDFADHSEQFEIGTVVVDDPRSRKKTLLRAAASLLEIDAVNPDRSEKERPFVRRLREAVEEYAGDEHLRRR